MNSETVWAKVSSAERARQEIARLVENYGRLDARAIRAYNEANTCKDFILPLFRALGWDVYNSAEVSAERKVSRRRVDYAFRLGGIPKFFLEAKRFAADLEDPKWARQVINYAWIKGVSWAVLTDFEGLKVFNAEWKERNPRLNIFIDLTYEQYLDEFNRLWLLSKEAMAEGLLDREALRVGKKLKKRPIGEYLFGELVRWREKLHHYLRLYNPEFSDDQIDEAVQRILDRLIFIRTCEDREIEPPTLRALLREWRNGGRRKDLVKLLSEAFRDFDEGYDARLFAPHFGEKLSCEPGPFEEVIEGLHSTKDGIIEYDFNAIDVDVLGGIYEQYLGYVAKVVERRERREEPLAVEVIERKGWRKKHGIYYTPQFVVRYIVANTLGRLLEEMSYNEVKQLKVLDPACGSGSFLIEAFDVLDKYHRRIKGKDKVGGEESVQADFLDFAQRVEILTSNIYGVDLDAQAVEIARLNLLLKTLTQRAQLPDLANNIRQGNSLISGTPEELREHFGESWEEKHPFNWEEEFPRIMERGGFDVIVGNPPYVFGEYVPASEKGYFGDHYRLATAQYDIFWLFYERCLSLLKEGGYHGFIVPDALLVRDEPAVLREMLLRNGQIIKIAHVGPVFEDPAVSAVIIIFRKIKDDRQTHIIEVDELSKSGQKVANPVAQRQFLSNLGFAFTIWADSTWQSVLEKLSSHGIPLGNLMKVTRGEELGKKNLLKVKGPPPPATVPILAGEDVSRYRIVEPRHVVPSSAIAKPRSNYVSPKILIVKTGRKLVCALDPGDRLTLQSLYNLQPKPSCRLRLEYLLGILNSALLSVYIQRQVTAYKKVFPQINMGHVRGLPIRRIDFDNLEEKKMHDDLVALVERVLELNKRLKDAVGRESEELKRKIARTDGEIDELVYGLYGLTKEEIAVRWERATRRSHGG